MIQNRRAFIRNCGILLAAAIATPSAGTSISAGAMRLGPAVNLAMMRKAALEQHMNDMERALFFEPDYKEQWRVHVHKTVRPGPSRLERILAESKPVESHDFQWLDYDGPGESRDRPERVDLPPHIIRLADTQIQLTDAHKD